MTETLLEERKAWMTQTLLEERKAWDDTGTV